MMLTGQVFAIMSGVAEDEQIRKITKSADHYLYRKEIGGYRLNTDFQELKFDMGRMFGFAYGEKENGAVFSHMTTMYANALYRRGFVKEGFKALKTLADTALNFDISRIYPGIPEYFRADGRGMYQLSDRRRQLVYDDHAHGSLRRPGRGGRSGAASKASGLPV